MNWLEKWLGDNFVARDVAEADLCSIGIASPQDPQRLVYISTYQTPDGLYNVDLETAPATDADFPLRVKDEYREVSREELFRLTIQHLGIAVESSTSISEGAWYPKSRVMDKVSVEAKPKKKLNAKQKRALKAADVQLFAKEYQRKAQCGQEPNDRKYRRDIEKKSTAHGPGRTGQAASWRTRGRPRLAVFL